MKKLVAVICLIAFFGTQSCVEGRYRDGRAEGKGVHTEEKSFESFDGIKVSRLFKAKVVKGDKYEVKTNVPARYADRLSVEIDSENNIVITLSGSIDTKRREVFEAEITCPSFERIIAEDLSIIDVVSGFSAENMELSAYSLSEISVREQLKVENNCNIKAASSKIKLNVNAESIYISSSDMSKVTASGTVSSLEVDANSMASVNCRRLSAKTVRATANSMADISVVADEKFDLDASDMSRIKYSGNGEVIRKEAASMSIITKR